MAATFVPISGNPALGDAFALPNLTGVTDYTICCFFRQTGYGGGGTSIAVPYIKNLTGFNDNGGSYCFYFSDFSVGASAAAAASWNGTGGETTTTLAAATLGVLHSFVVTKNAGVIKFWLDNSNIWSATGATTATTAQNIRIGCHSAGGANQYFQWAQIGQWAFFKRGWTTGEIATFDGGRDAITQRSEDIFTTIGISRTSIAYYVPLVSSIAETVAGATVTTIGSPTLLSAVARMRLAQIAPGSGDLLYMEMEKISDSSNVLGGTYNGGLTITPPSGSPIPLTLTQCATRMPFMWAPLDRNFEAIQSDTDAAKTGGTWTANGTADNGKFGWHNSGDVNRFTMSYGNQFSQSSAASAVATWTFTGVPPGKYIAVAIYHADADRTSQATYTIKDGATTVKTFTQDQRVTMRYDTTGQQQVEFNTVDGRRAMVLGSDPKLTAPNYTNNLFTITTGTTVTVAVTNTAGSGVLTANLMGLRRIIQPFPSGCVLNAPPGWCTTAAGDANAVVNFPVGPVDLNAFMPFNPAAPRPLKVGYNIEYHKFGRPALFYADRMRASDSAWQGSGFTVDSDQNLLTVTGSTYRVFEAQPIQRSYDGAVLPTIKEFGTWTVKYTIVTGTPSVLIRLSEDHGEIIGAPTGLSLVGGKMVFSQTIDTRGTIHPGAASLYVQVSGGAAKVEIYGPEVPSGWTSIYHPSLISLLANRGFDVIRANPLAVTFDESEVDWTDSPSETASSIATPRTIRTFNVISVGPANRADLVPWYGAQNGSCAVLITTAAPHGIRSGDFIFMPTRDSPTSDGLSEDGSTWGITTTLGFSTSSIFRGSTRFCVRVSATTFIWLGFGPNSGEVDIANPAQCITLTSTHAVTGHFTVMTGRYTPHAHMAGLCNECNIRTLHVNLSLAVTDAYVTSLADRLATALGAGKKVRLSSRGNEIWNPGLAQTQVATIWEYHTQWLWNTTGHAQGAPVGAAEGYAFLMWRLDQDAQIFRARFALAGRPATDVITVLESALGGVSHTAQACDFAGATGTTPFDEVAVATYRDLLENNDPTDASVGYTTNFFAGFAAVSDTSAVSLLWLGQKYSNMVGSINQQNDLLARKAGFAGKPVVTYEGGDQGIAFGRPRPSLMYRNPLMYRKELAVLQMLQNDASLKMENRYVLNYPDGPNDGAQWNDYLTSFMDAGTGDPAESLSSVDMRSGETTATFGPGALSQTGGARRLWASTVVSSGIAATVAVTTGAAILGASFAATASGGSITPATRHVPRNRPAGASPTPIVVTTPGASSGPRSAVVTGWPATWTTFPMILTATRGTTNLLGNLEVTAQSAGTLTISGAIEYGDFALAASDVLECHSSALAITEIHADLDTKASLNSPALSGTPTVPTAGLGTNNAQAASTAFVTAAIAGRELVANKGIAGGYAGLDGSGKVPLAQLPVAPAPARVVYTSSPPAGMAVPVSDAVLTLGDITDGTDNTAALQAILNLNSGGGTLRIIVDGAYTISGVMSNDNTEIILLPGCGLKRLSTSHVALISNTTESFGVGSGATRALGNFGDRNITIRGGIFHCNANNTPSYIASGQSDLRVPAVRMMGVSGLILDGLTVLDVGCYGIHIANVEDVHVTNCRQLLTSIGVVGPDGRDGFHINGPADKVWIDNCSWMAADDTLALNANDGDRTSALPTSGRGQFPYPGPITNVFVNNLYINNSMRGIRLLSSDQVIDNVVIRNVTGSAGSIALLVSGFLPGGVEGGNNPRPGAGLVGNVTIDGLDVLVPDNGAAWTSPVYLGCNFANLKIHGLRFRPDANNTRASMHVTSNVTYNTLDIDVDVLDLDPANRPRTILQDDGVGDLVRMSGSLRRPNLSAVAFPAFYKNAGSLNMLRTNLAWDNSTITNLLFNGSITTVQMSGSHTNSLGNGALNIQSGKTVANFGHTDLLAAVAKDGPGTVTHDIGSGSYTDPDSRKVGLLASYRMADANGTALLDSSVNVRSGTANASISHTTGIAGFATCALANGTNFYTVPNASNALTPTASGFTVTGWISFASVTAVQIVCGVNDGIAVPGFLLYLTTDGKLHWQVGTHLGATGPEAISTALTAATTYFFRAGYNGSDTVNLRINEGTAVTTVLSVTAVPTGVNLGIFADMRTPTAAQLGNGTKLDRLRLWNRQLTTTEGAAEYGGGTGNDWE